MELVVCRTVLFNEWFLFLSRVFVANLVSIVDENESDDKDDFASAALFVMREHILIMSSVHGC